MGIELYYQDKWVTIYHGDCREVLPQLPKVDLVLTDPSFPDVTLDLGYKVTPIDFLSKLDCRQLVFWSARLDFPLDYTAIHIWDKLMGCVAEYVRIFERNGQRAYKIYRYNAPNSIVSAKFSGDTFLSHPSQQPQKLISRLIADYSATDNLILDPFLGSGTTCCCAKKLLRKSIGIEIEEKYCEMAVDRCRQMVMEFED